MLESKKTLRKIVRIKYKIKELKFSIKFIVYQTMLIELRKVAKTDLNKL